MLKLTQRSLALLFAVAIFTHVSNAGVVIDIHPTDEGLNEPMVEDPYRWYGIHGQLIASIRADAPNHTIIASGQKLGKRTCLTPKEFANFSPGFIPWEQRNFAPGYRCAPTLGWH